MAGMTTTKGWVGWGTPSAVPFSIHSSSSLDGAKAPHLRLGHAQVYLGATLAFRLVFDFAQDDGEGCFPFCIPRNFLLLFLT